MKYRNIDRNVRSTVTVAYNYIENVALKSQVWGSLTLAQLCNILWLQSKLLEHIESNLLTCVVIFTVGPSVFIGVNGRNRE